MARAGPSSKPSGSNPYDRPSYQLKVRGTKANPTSALDSSSKPKSKSTSASVSADPLTNSASVTGEINVGAPAQLGQVSRKGKKAWRKNIDVRDIEKGMEEMREEERVTGGKIRERRNEALFTVDVTVDASLAENLRKNRPKKPLRSLAVLSERSAVPSLTSRSLPSAPATKTRPQEKARLRRLALREHRLEGQSASQIPIQQVTATLDAWAPDATLSLPGGFGEEAIKKPKPKLPVTLAKRREHLHDAIENGRTVDLPEAGASYNPTLESHKKLIDLAVEEEKAKLVAEKKVAERIKERGMVVENRRGQARVGEYAEGMVVDSLDGDGDGGESDIEVSGELKKKQSKRKTQAQRNRAIRLRDLAEAEKRAKQTSKLSKSIGALAAFKKAEQEREAVQKEAARLRRVIKRENERLGFVGGEKVGKYTVRKGDVPVQLGEDLAETLRQVKPEGNQFKDQFLALQRKGLVEPRMPATRKQNKNRTKEYEKHAYKRFV